MISAILSFYRPNYPTVLVYMLQSTEYNARSYLEWYWRTQNFNKVRYRGDIKKTKAARLLLLSIRLGILLELAVGALLILLWHFNGLAGGWQFGLALILVYPVIWAHLLVLPLIIGRATMVEPKNKLSVSAAKKTFNDHKAIKIAVAGSYGKTTMKELLLTVLKEGKSVAATPANKNVTSSHAIFAKALNGKEDILIIEYGEGAPGDVPRFASITKPSHAIITGIAPAHLDKYKTLAAAAKDIFSLVEFVPSSQLYINKESPDARPYIKDSFHSYDVHGALGWKVSNIDVSLTATSFTMSKGQQSLHVTSGLIGRHHIGSLVLVAALALQLGLSEAQVLEGLQNTEPFEHRMKPYLLNDAWVIDDTYNGNIEGIRAGTALLAELKATRKIYVTPGLVDQGAQKKSIHREVGKLIAAAKPDMVILIKNSVAKYIEEGLRLAKYKGQIIVEHDPLSFYSNLKDFVASGDVVLLQNDWPDQYH